MPLTLSWPVKDLAIKDLVEGLLFLRILAPDEAMPEETPSDGSNSSRFRTTLIRVIIVQAVALGLLLLLQLRYTL